jgi:multidrug resistance efflux pump
VARDREPRSLAPEIHVFGRVENPNTTALRAATLAYVSEVNVREGQASWPGDVLLRLDDRDARLAVQRAEAALTEARGEYERLLAQQERRESQRRAPAPSLRADREEAGALPHSVQQGQVSATDYDALEQQRLEMEMALNQQEMLLASTTPSAPRPMRG